MIGTTAARAKCHAGVGPLERRVRQLFRDGAKLLEEPDYFGAEAEGWRAALIALSSLVSHSAL
jgi:hypothetical protein